MSTFGSHHAMYKYIGHQYSVIFGMLATFSVVLNFQCLFLQCNLDYPDPFGHSLDASIPDK